jgi:hypothetical protein
VPLKGLNFLKSDYPFLRLANILSALYPKANEQKLLLGDQGTHQYMLNGMSGGGGRVN